MSRYRVQENRIWNLEGYHNEIKLDPTNPDDRCSTTSTYPERTTSMRMMHDSIEPPEWEETLDCFPSRLISNRIRKDSSVLRMKIIRKVRNCSSFFVLVARDSGQLSNGERRSKSGRRNRC
ncbi:uncharacterized protein [Bombus fervidus]|uniref:uncharacterized protein n=1 Tax=Bombus fervidus TaxID=203811 RepID=UPI003D18C29A